MTRRSIVLLGTALAAVLTFAWLGSRAARWIGASWADHAEVAPLEPWSPHADLRQTFDSLPGGPDTTARLALLDANRDAWVARWQMLQAARERIDVASFIVRDDLYGLAFLGHLLRKARSGVHVRLLFDAYGTSMGRSMFDEDYLDELVAAGVEVRIYRPFFSRILQALARLDPVALIASEHDKLLLVDGTWSLVGGRNVGHEYFADPAVAPRAFLDVDVVAVGAGIHDELLSAFDAEWSSEAAYAVPDEELDLASREQALLGAYRAMDAWLDGREPSPDDPAARAHLEDLRRDHPDLAGRLRSHPVLPVDGAEHEVRVLNSVPRPTAGDDPVSRGLARLVRSARCSVLIQSPYLVLSEPAAELLGDAGRRGVDVTVLTNSPVSSDNALSQAFFLRQWPELLARVPGLELFVRGDRHNLHGKVAVFDDRVTVIATYNLDPVSMAVDGEVALVVWSESFARRTTRTILDSIEAGPPTALRYRIERAPDGTPLRDADGEPRELFGPREHDALEGRSKLRAWSLALRAVRALSPSHTLFWASRPPASRQTARARPAPRADCGSVRPAIRSAGRTAP